MGGKLLKKIAVGSEPTVVAELSNTGAALSAKAQQQLTPRAQLEFDLRLPYSRRWGTVDPTMKAKTIYKIGGGKVVANAEMKASAGGLRGTQVSATYDLGA